MPLHLKPKTIIATISTIYLLLLTSLAAYALHKTNHLTLPLPNILAALAIALPPLAGVALETATSLVTSANASSSSLTLAKSKKTQITPARAQLILNATLAFLLIYETALATLAGTHLRASDCGLRDVWMGMWRAKDGEGIRAIQDSLGCCGFDSTRDMAWPFPGAGRGVGECEARWNGEGSVGRCLEGLRGEERAAGGLVLGVCVGVFVWKCIMLALPTSDGRSWLPSGIQLPGESERPRRIEYRDAEEAGEEDSLADEVSRLNSDSQLASTIEGTRSRPSVLLPRENTWVSTESDVARG